MTNFKNYLKILFCQYFINMKFHNNLIIIFMYTESYFSMFPSLEILEDPILVFLLSS